VTAPCRKAIIVAAGRGRRLGGNTDAIPKCMVEVGGRPILHWQLGALAMAGIDDIVVVRGYRGDRIDPGEVRVRFIDNPEWERNNILASLLYAQREFAGGFYFSYCDIVYTPAAVTGLAAAAHHGRAAASLTVDRRWADTYQGRDQHPVSEAELTLVEEVSGQAVVRQVGKQAVAQDRAAGEFIGLAHFSDAGGAALARVWQRALDGGGLEAPFGRARALRQAYLTDALNAMADEGLLLVPVFIDGKWREIDTEQDLAAAGRVVTDWAG
jgi:choline kinase